MAGSEVGRVGLGIEFIGDIGKQVSSMAHQMGQRLAKSFGATLRGMDFSDAMKEAIKGASDIDKAMKNTVSGIKDAEKSLSRMSDKMKSVVMPAVPASSVTPSVPAAAVKPKAVKSASAFDVDAARAEIDQLTAVLDNLNAKLEIQNRKLADLKQQYAETFNDAQKNKLLEQIVNTEGTILRLTKRSDDAAQKIWRLEDSINSAGQAIGQQFEPPVNRAERSVKRVNKSLIDTDKRLKATAREANRTGKALASAGKSANKMGNQFTQAFKRIAKQVLIFAVIYKAIRGLQDYIGSSLRTNDEYAKSLAQIQVNLKAAFAPIFQAILPAINALIKAMVTATTYVAAFTSALFGKTYKQSLQAAKGLDAARAALDKYNKSANKLAGFDELNVLDTSQGDDGGFAADLAAFEAPEIDVDRIQLQMDSLVLGIRSSFDRAFSYIRNGWQSTTSTFGPSLMNAWSIMQPELGKWKEQFGSMFADIISLGEPLKNWWRDSVIPLWHSSIANMSVILTGLSDSVRNVFDSIWQAAFPIIDQFVTDGLPRIAEFADSVQNVFTDMFIITKDIFDDIWQDAFDPTMQLISQTTQDTLSMLIDWWDEWGAKIVDNISESLEKIRELWDNLWTKALKPIVTRMLETMQRLWDNHLKGLLTEIGKFIGKLITAAQDIFNKFIMPIVNWLVDLLGPAFAEVFDLAATIVLTALGTIIDVASGIITALGGIIDFIAGVFTADWERAWEGIKQIFSGIGDAIGSIFKGAINVIIDTFNWMIRQLNKVRIDMPGWVQDLTGWKGFGINIPEIPRLAKGGLVTAPTLAMVGDNPGANVDPEVVAPLSKLQEMLGGVGSQEVVDVLYMILAALQDYSRRPVLLEANGTQLAKVIDDARDDRYRRAGRTFGLT